MSENEVMKYVDQELTPYIDKNLIELKKEIGLLKEQLNNLEIEISKK